MMSTQRKFAPWRPKLRKLKIKPRMEADQGEVKTKTTIKIRYLSLVLSVMKTFNTTLMTMKMSRGQSHENTGGKVNENDLKLKILSQIRKFCEEHINISKLQ